MSKHVLRPSVFLLFVAAGLLCIMSVGGCPAPQTPTTPPAEDEDQATQPTTPPVDNGLPRPIEPPDLNGDTTTPDSDGTTPPDSDVPDGDQPSFVMVSINQPSDNIAVGVPPRVDPAPIINLQFNLTDGTGAVVKGELLLARDDDADGQPDGAPVHVQEIAISAGTNTWAFDTNTVVQKNLLNNSYGRFVLGARATTASNDEAVAYSTATLTIDGIAPEWTWNGAGPTLAEIDKEDHLVNRDTTWTISLDTTDNSPHTWRVLLDMDLTPGNGNEFQLVEETNAPADADTRTPPDPLTLTIYPSGTYYYYVIVSDGIDPPDARYAESDVPEQLPRLAITNRLIGEFDLDELEEEAPVPSQSKGAIMEGFQFNDLAGSSMVSVPDLDGDGDSELVIGARFAKPSLDAFDGVGWGAAYLIYGGGGMRLTGTEELNSVGSLDQSGIAGVTFRGIRIPQNTDYTEGLADITVIDDMDGDDLPEIVFSFPRAESICLQVEDPSIQHPDLIWDEQGMGVLEYNAFHNLGDPAAFDSPVWNMDEAQFTRGGIVIVSSHNEMLKDNDTWTRHGDRLLDLHEIGQMFNFMVRPSLAPYIRGVYRGDPAIGSRPPTAWFTDPNSPYCWDCELNEYDPDTGECTSGCGDCDPNYPEEETEYDYVVRVWDVWLGGG